MHASRKKRVLIIVHGAISRQPRVLMEIDALAPFYEVYVAGWEGEGIQGIRFIDIQDTLDPDPVKLDFHHRYPSIFRKLISFFIRVTGYKKREILDYYDYDKTGHVRYKLLKRLWHIQPALIIVHNLELLPLALSDEFKGAKVIANAHEYYPSLLSDVPGWNETEKPKADLLCRDHLTKADKVWTVCDSISAKYFMEFGVRSVVIRNSKPFIELPVQTIDEKNIRIVHHGSAIPSRKIGVMISMMDHLPSNYSLHLYLVPAYKEYYETLRSDASSNPRVVFHDPVKTSEIIQETNQYDIGLFLLPPVNFNYENALPNKFFEFVQARLALAIGPSPEMKKYVEKYKLGMLAADFSAESMAKVISGTSAVRLMEFKNNAHKAAIPLSDVEDRKIILEEVRSLTGPQK